jgi:hypothetical protein
MNTPAFPLVVALGAAVVAQSLAPTNAHAAPSKDELAAEVEKTVATLDVVRLDQYYRDNEFDKYVARAKACVDAVRDALDAGVAESHSVKVIQDSDDIPQTKKGYAALSDVKDYCGARYTRLRANRVRNGLQPVSDSLHAYGEMEELDDMDIIVLESPVKKCFAAIRWGHEHKLPADTVIDIKGARPMKVTFADANDQLCKLLDDTMREKSEEWAAAQKAAEEALLGPFRKALKGDKISIFESRYMVELDVYTKGAYAIEKPKEFAKASLWFIVLNREGDDGRTWWVLRRFAFKGNKLVKESETTGLGDMPADKHFR